MKRLLIIIVSVCFLNLCLAESVREKRLKTNDVQKHTSIKRTPTTGKIEQVKKETETSKTEKEKPQQAKPTQQSKTEIELLQKQISSLQWRVTVLETEINDLQTYHQKKISELQSKLSVLQEKIDGFEPIAPTIAGDIIGFIKDGHKYVFTANGAKIEIDIVGNVSIKSPMNIILESNANMNIKSSMIRLNNGGKPIARTEDIVTGNCPFHTEASGVVIVSGPLQSGSIIGPGSPLIHVP
jgi:uncharacterized protein YueI